MDNKEKIVRVLSENKDGLKAGEIAEKTGIDKNEADKII
jgi:predicted Zn-ribbon and HTH transcriptional regulator